MAARHDGQAAGLGADLDDDLRRLDRVDRSRKLLHVSRHRLLDVNVFSGLGGGFQLGGVVVVRRGDHHGVDILAGHDVAVAEELLHLGAVPFFAHRGGFFAGQPPGIAHGNKLDVLLRVVLMHADHVRQPAAPPATDLGNPDPVVGARDTGVAAHREGQRRCADGGRRYEIASCQGCLHCGLSPLRLKLLASPGDTTK